MMELTDILARIVDEAGYLAVTEDNKVTFKVEGVEHRFELFGDDTDYARLIIGFTNPPNVSADALLKAANARNQAAKAVKTVIYGEPEDGWVNFSVELFFDDVTAWEPIFNRAVTCLRIASDEFYQSVQSGATATA